MKKLFVTLVCLFAVVNFSFGQFAQQELKDVLQSIPSSVEIAVLLKEVGADQYRSSDLNPYNQYTKYASNYKKAINLGIYSTDLGYANISRKNQDAINLLGSVQSLTKDLSVNEFYDFMLLNRLAKSQSFDSLLLVCTQGFEKMSDKLVNQKREWQSVMMLTGAWLESAYLTGLVYERTKHEKLRTKIAEQKVVLNRLMTLLDTYRGNIPSDSNLYDLLEELKVLYAGVKISTKQGTATTKVVNGVVVTEDSSVMTISVTDATITALVEKIKAVRNEMVE